VKAHTGGKLPYPAPSVLHQAVNRFASNDKSFSETAFNFSWHTSIRWFSGKISKGCAIRYLGI